MGTVVADPAGEVSFAGDGDDHIRTGFHDNTARESTTCCHCQRDAILFREREEILYDALAAALAILDLVRDLHSALGVLKAVRHQQQDLLRRPSVPALREYQVIVDGHKGMLHFFFSKTDQLSDHFQDRQPHPDGNGSHPM